MTAPENDRLDPAIAARLKRNADGLVPTVVQDATSREVLMLAWMDDEALARTLARFPQKTMNADRMSAYTQWDLPLPQALHQEWERGKHCIGDGLQGAGHFADATTAGWNGAAATQAQSGLATHVQTWHPSGQGPS